MVALGVVVLLATQAFINVAVTVGLLPTTGVTLPFVSYGGSSMLTRATGHRIRAACRCSYAATRDWRAFRTSTSACAPHRSRSTASTASEIGMSRP